jgi:hypothetical protein
LVRLLDLHATVDRLPVPAAGQLTDATQQALDRIAGGSPGTLEPGDHYLDADGHARVATEALTTVPVYALQLQPINVTSMFCPGLGLCALRSPIAQTSADAWLLFGQLVVTWRYSDLRGRVVLSDGLAAPVKVTHLALIQVGVRRITGGWQVSLMPGNLSNEQDLPLCEVGTSVLDVVRYQSDQTTVSPLDLSYQWPQSATLPELGCVFGGGHVDAQINLTGPVALVLYRCGALLAVNAEATRIFPHLPRASAHEQALALAAWPPTAATAGPGA